MKTIHGFAVLVAALTAASAESAPVYGRGTWEATLQARDLDSNTANGAEAFYDTALNITWLADANAGAGSTFDDGSSSTDGAMTLPNAWAASLNVHGVTGWRLPATIEGLGCDYQRPLNTCGYGVDPNTSELAHLYYVTLGNLPSIDPSTGLSMLGGGLTNTGPFLNVQSNNYWSRTPAGIDPNYSWMFEMTSGYQTIYSGSDYFAWATHEGDVGEAIPAKPLPEPASYALVLAGLAALAASRRYAAASSTS